MRMRWIVAGRWVALLIINGRCMAILTGRLAALAASAASTASARMNSFPPKPPPMNGESSRTLSFGMRRIEASAPRPQAIIWLLVHTVSLSPSHAAMVANGSIIAWLSSGVVYVRSSVTGAAANALAKSPFFLTSSGTPQPRAILAPALDLSRS